MFVLAGKRPQAVQVGQGWGLDMPVEQVKVSRGLEPYRIACSEIWGGIRNVDVDVRTNLLTASIYSHSCRGGKGGDIYYLSVCDTDRLTRIAVADVVGHGQVVSAISGWVYEALAMRMNDPAGSGLLEDLNRRIAGRGLAAMTTAVILGLHGDDSHMHVAYAGHPPLLMCRRGESRWHVAGAEPGASAPNLPLGVEEDVRFAQGRFAVGSGDRLLAYTDGLIERPVRSRSSSGSCGS